MSTATMMRGAAAGAVATVPMTGVMLALHRALPVERERTLVPVEVTGAVAEATGFADRLRGGRLQPATWALHIAYGAAAGVLYRTLSASSLLGRAAAGAGFGLIVWGGSYLGYLPAAGLRQPATRDPWERNLTMIAAHIVFGATLGLLVGPRRHEPEDPVQTPPVRWPR